MLQMIAFRADHAIVQQADFLEDVKDLCGNSDCKSAMSTANMALISLACPALVAGHPPTECSPGCAKVCC
jgi:hypothetical protein